MPTKENGDKCVLCLDIFAPCSYLCLYHLGIYNAVLLQMIRATTENDVPAPLLLQALALVLAHDQLN